MTRLAGFAAKRTGGGKSECIAAVKALDGKNFAMLSPEEEELLSFYRSQGRKFGVAVCIISDVDPEELARAPSQLHVDQILKRGNSRISVTVG